jgi:hypothetical protein
MSSLRVFLHVLNITFALIVIAIDRKIEMGHQNVFSRMGSQQLGKSQKEEEVVDH